ncbi:sensor histidine kinase [Hespellia stercorisuis]|uniref:histidine kinase n=1 Tax=Hespellia stercorisuis DSM 15480 TaxID=1121950 RepID=A0A1M6MNA4_9FIRM|nr:HAMP domain-containing sensor histidine kinase [Hespellia stercorisuis]SHJ84850.1 His Kinase A (phospho-acceptor) domain-containing protein [Hespellia stercorisuis DSM 15480]
MFKKLHLQLTFFFTAVTGAILIAMTALCLYLSENGMIQNNYVTFLNTTNTMMTYMTGQDIITHEWLASQERDGNYLVSIYDNGVPLYMDRLAHGSEDSALLEQAAARAEEDYGFDITSGSADRRLSDSQNFSMKDEQGTRYEVCVMTLPKNDGVLHALVLYSRASEHTLLLRQRWFFALLVLAGILLLAIFCWFFTEYLIRPIEESRRKQAQFIASASHELRSPLSVVLSSVSALKKAAPEDAPRFTEAIRSESARMARLVDEMLTLAGSDAHNWQIKKVPTQLDTLILDTYEKYELLARSQHIRLSVNLPEVPLPECNCDGGRIEQILSILLDNALSYTPGGGHVVLSLTHETHRFLIRVSDSGPGIPDAQKALIFERFYRVQTSRTDKEHFGLGLCIAAEIIHLHRGRIWVEDAPGGGSDFFFSLPA